MGSFFCCLSGIKTLIVNARNFFARKSGSDTSPMSSQNGMSLSLPCNIIQKKCGLNLNNYKSNETLYVFNLMVTKLASITTISCSLPQTFKILSHENRVLGFVHKIDLLQFPGVEAPSNEMDKITYELEDTKTTKGESDLNGHSHNGLPDLINQKGSSQLSNTNDKARKFLEGLDGVKFNEIKVPDNLKKQLEYFDRDELLQLIAYQKKYLDYKESRIKDLENYIDNLVVKIIETEPLILMNASNVLNKSSTKLI